MRLVDRFTAGDPHRFGCYGESEAAWFDRTVLSHTALRDPFDKEADTTVRVGGGGIFAGKLDWVLLSPRLRCVRRAVLPGDGRSDHDMLYVELQDCGYTAGVAR